MLETHLSDQADNRRVLYVQCGDASLYSVTTPATKKMQIKKYILYYYTKKI